MDYEKKYKALVEAVKTLKEANPSDDGIQNWVKDNVPELKESDERIREELLEHCINRIDGKQVCVDASDYRRWADWLFRIGKENTSNVKNDKVIRNEIIKFLELPHPQFVGKRHQEEWIAWLEKQNHDGKKWIYEDVYLKEKEQLIQDGIDEVLENPQKYGLEKQGEKASDKIVEKAKNEKQRVLLTETNGNANIDWDARSLKDVKALLEHGLDYIKKLEKQGEQKQWDSVEPVSEEDKLYLMPEEQKPANMVEPKFKVGDIIKPKDRGHEPWQIMQVDILDKKYRFKDGYVIHFSQEDNYELVEQKPADVVEPKFHEGQWISNGDYTWKIVEVKPLDYILQSQDGDIVDDTISHVDAQFHSFTIEDAKDGDVLVFDDIIMIFKNIKTVCTANTYILYCNGIVVDDWCDFGHNAQPATKEQRGLLFQKMKEAGYEWNSDKKKLEKDEIKIKAGRNYCCTKTHIYAGLDWLEGTKYYADDDYSLVNNGCTCFCPKYSKYEHNNLFEEVECDGCIEKQCEQKPAWSEEDENAFDSILNDLRQGVMPDDEDMNWLKSLKDRVGCEVNCTTAKEWSKEDERMRCLIISHFESHKLNHEYITTDDKVIKWLNSLKKSRTKQEFCECDEIDIQAAIEICENAGYDLIANRLKSLKDRYTWKPSKEQMDALDSTLQYSQVSHNSYEHLNSLFNDLKKLKE